MGLLIGMDEAGYGPNLGPLVITATAWEVPGSPKKCDLWQEFADVVRAEAPEAAEHIQIGDSKAVYTPGSLESLERGVLGALALTDDIPRSFRALSNRLTADALNLDDDPWFRERDLDLPMHADLETVTPLIASWKDCCAARGIQLRAIRSEIVLPQRFNRITNSETNKARALSETSMQVLRHVLSEADVAVTPTIVFADKHGGRNRYHDFLPCVVGDQFIMCLEEGAECSRYKAGQAEFRFETRSERYLPVALASMVSKYVRELAMILFNRFWIEKLPELKPTAGYPVDARRFRSEISATQKRLGIADHILWRDR